MRIPFTFSNGSITVFLDGVPTIIDSTHPNQNVIYDIIRATGLNLTDAQVDEFRKLVSIPETIKAQVDAHNFGDVTVGLDAVLYKGKPINSYLTTTMLNMLGQGIDIAPWALFMDKLYKNPSKTAVDELFLWLDKANMPITDDGCFFAYKKVKDDYTSFHKAPGGVDVANTPGTVVEMPRNEVDDNRSKTCSYGLHFCSYHYLPSYHGSQGKVVLVKIDPADVVSIPSDYDNAKGRASKYTVVGEIAEKDAAFAFKGASVVTKDYVDAEVDSIQFFDTLFTW